MADSRQTSGLLRGARSVVLTGRGVGFLAAAVVCFIAAPILSLPALLYVTGLLLGLVVLCGAFVVVGHSKVRIERSFTPQVVHPGHSSRTTVRVTNLSVLPCLEARWQDSLPAGVTGEASGVLPAMGGCHGDDARITFTYTLQGGRRGLHRIGPLRVEVVDPFGLVFRRHSFGEAQELTVLPRRVDLPAVAPRGTSEDGATQPAPQHAGVGDEDVVARVYMPGDAMKRLHWKATAHRGELMVRQEEQQINPRAGVYLDCDPASLLTERGADGVWEHSPTFEWGVVATASIVSYLVRAGHVVVLRSSGGSVDRLVADGHDTLEDAMVDLAVVEPEPAEGSQVLDAPERASFVVLGRVDAARARVWASALASSRTVSAFVAAGTSEEVLDILAGARWRVSVYRPQSDLAELWTAFDGTRAHASI